MGALTCGLIVNSYHKKGDKNPALKTFKETITITQPGEYEVAVWAPKEAGKKYYMKLSIAASTSENGTQAEQSQGSAPIQNTTPVQAEKQATNPKSLFKR